MISKRTLAIACSLALVGTGPARADIASDLKTQMDVLQRQLDQVKSQLYNLQEEMKKQKENETEKAQALQEATKGNGPWVTLKPDSGATFLVPGGGEVQLYGNLDVSFDYTTKGLKADYGDNGGMPVGNVGWQPAISTNLSYVGFRGTHPLQPDLGLIWQLEAGIDVSATPGIKETTSNTSYTVNGALFSRNSFIGFAGKDWGAAMIGKSETPYKTSTDRLNPFSGMLGDYRVMIGNTGGNAKGRLAQLVDPAATTAWSSVCAPRMRSGTSRPVGQAHLSRRCTHPDRTVTTQAASFPPGNPTAPAATSPEAARCPRPAMTARSVIFTV